NCDRRATRRYEQTQTAPGGKRSSAKDAAPLKQVRCRGNPRPLPFACSCTTCLISILVSPSRSGIRPGGLVLPLEWKGRARRKPTIAIQGACHAQDTVAQWSSFKNLGCGDDIGLGACRSCRSPGSPRGPVAKAQGHYHRHAGGEHGQGKQKSD